MCIAVLSSRCPKTALGDDLTVPVVPHAPDLLLEILREVQEIEELGYPGSGAAQLPCQVRPRQILQLHGSEKLLGQ